MDDLREIIQTFDDDDVREFRHFLNRHRQKSKRMDTALFDLLASDREVRSVDTMKALYGRANKEAYYALRKRLSAQLTDFVVLKSRSKDSTSVSNILEWMNLSQYLFDQKKNRLAGKYLKKARRMAEEVQHFELLNAIYNQLIDKTEWQEEKELRALIKKREENRLRLEEEENINLANSIIKHTLIEFQRHGKEVDFSKLMRQVFREYRISEKAMLNPRNAHKLMSMIRGVIKARKNYDSFAPFIMRRYAAIEEAGQFSNQTVFYQMALLYFISHTLYRSKKFEKAMEYLEKLGNLMEGAGNSYRTFYFSKYMQLKSAIHVFEEDLDASMQSLNVLLDEFAIHLTAAEKLNITINIGINHYLKGEVNKAHQVLMSIYHTDKWCEKAMGREWVLKKNLMEVILYYDMDKLDTAESRIRSIERNFKDIIKSSMYSRVKMYLMLVKQFIMRPYDAKTEAFYKLVQDSIDWKPFEQEDLQAMGFYAWIKSKMQGRTLYEVWLDLVKGS